MASSSTAAAVPPMVSSEVRDEENRSVVNTAIGGVDSLVPGVVGARFRPSDEDLSYYLAKKVSGCTDGKILRLIKEIDVYQCEPWLLKGQAHDFGDGIMYLFTPVKMKSVKGKNVDRLAGKGFWKINGKISDIESDDGTIIATKTPLVYCENSEKRGESPRKTQWLMKQIILQKQSDEKPEKLLALCVIYLFDRKRKQCENDKKALCDDDVEASCENFAENFDMPSAENSDFPRKRHCPSFGLDEIFSHQIPMACNDRNQGKASCSNAQSDASSNPSATFESLPTGGIPFSFPSSEGNFLDAVEEECDPLDLFFNEIEDEVPILGKYEDPNSAVDGQHDLLFDHDLLLNPP